MYVLSFLKMVQAVGPYIKSLNLSRAQEQCRQTVKLAMQANPPEVTEWPERYMVGIGGGAKRRRTV